jgi:hypothetical protein
MRAIVLADQCEEKRLFLKRLGMKRLKVGVFPAKADPEVQETFRGEQLEPRIKEAQAGKRVLFL